MENSLRNHALVQQQNQQKQLDREEFYRNHGIIRSSSTAAPASSSLYGNNSAANNTNSNKSRASGGSSSGKGSRSSGTGSSSRSRSTRSGEASDEAVQGIPESSLQHRHHGEYHSQEHHQQQQYVYHHQQRYPQHHQQYYAGANVIGLHQQQQQYDQYGYPVYRNSLSSSQQSPSHYYHHHQQQQYGGHAGGSTAEATASSQSHYSNILGSISGSIVSNPTAEEAYRRVGMRLSMSAHGGDSDGSRSSSARKPPARMVFKSPSSCFRPFKEVLQRAIREREKEDTYSSGSSSKSRSRSKKGKGNIVRKMTLNANELFRLWHSEHSRIQPHHQRRRRKSGSGSSHHSSRSGKSERSSDRDEMSPHRRLAQMTLGDGSHMLPSSSKKQTGSLSAVIESASQNSSATTRSTATNSRNPRGRGDEEKSRTSSTIATDTSMGTRNSLRSFGTLPPRGKCLTQPSEGVSNESLCDNVEGNLIVYENDNIHVPKKQVCVLTRGKIPKGAPSSDFRVQSLLGQGTFAQVFRCLHVQTGQLVAVKIVKNKPAYTRQAAVEIDVIRALTTTQNRTANNKSSKNANESKDHKKSSSAAEGAHHNNSSDYMIDMVCYFLYKDHLCLVFELLGLNLYEVLKKRQFRGLPLSVTQTLVRQAVLGARTLAQRSIVHCDLKPENILLVNEDDSESVMSAGESKRLHTSSSLNAKRTSSTPNDKKQSDTKRTGDTSIQSSDADSTKNSNQQEDKTQAEQTQLSDNSKSTTETNNTTKNKGEKEKQQTPQSKAKSTIESSSHEKGKESPMESTIATNESDPTPGCSHQIKLIDFGSACFEGQMSHTYIQSRFYRSPEVLLGLAYDSAIDMWSLGCVAAELFLGLPILPGVHEHDQLLRIIEMIGDTPDWMLDQGTKSTKYFVKYFPAATPKSSTPVQSSGTTPDGRAGSTEAATSRSGSEGPRPLPQWRIKTQHEYISSLSHSDIEKKGGLAKLQKQPGNRYFKRKLLSDIILHKGQSGKQEDLRSLKSFIHFLYGTSSFLFPSSSKEKKLTVFPPFLLYIFFVGILDPDPWKRWTAFQVASHPFFTGAALQENIDPSKMKDENHANKLFNLYWEAPSDPSIYRRKLLNVQKTREKQQAARRGFNRGHGLSRSRSVSPSSQDGMPTVRNAFSNNNNNGDDTHSATIGTEEPINQGNGRHLLQGSYQGTFNMSSSMTQFGINQGYRLLGSSSGAQPGFSGPQSFSESGNSLGLPGSFNEVDFALALHRPGVVPMGDSVTTATTSTTSMSSGNNSRSTYNQNSNQTSQIGSYGTAQVLHYTNQQRRLTTGSVPRTSRSLNEGDLGPADSAPIPTLIDSHLQHVAYSSSQETGIGVGPPIELKPQIDMSVGAPIKSKDENISDEPCPVINSECAGFPSPEKIPATTKDTRATKPDDNLAPATNPVQPNQNLGVYDNQVYQQQIAAMQQQFQQQQLLLQQQQATLALQQEQLRVYYSNISGAAGISAQQFGIPGTPSAAMNLQQFGIAGSTATPASNVSSAVGITSQQFGIPGTQATTADSIKSQHFGIAGAQATPSTMLNPHQFGLQGAQAAPSTAVNPQQFAIPGTPAAGIGAQQFGIPNNTPATAQAAASLTPQFRLSGTATPVQAAASLTAQFRLAGTTTPVQGVGYYVITNPDGTQMIVPPNQGVAIPMTGQVSGIAPMSNLLPGQLQALPAGPTQIQGLARTGLPSVGLPPGTVVAGMPGIPTMPTGGIIPAAASVSSVAPGAIPTISSATSPGPGGLYSNNKNQQQHHHRHP